MEVKKAQSGASGEKSKEPEKLRKSSESKKRSSVVDSDDETEKPVTKRARPEGKWVLSYFLSLVSIFTIQRQKSLDKNQLF